MANRKAYHMLFHRPQKYNSMHRNLKPYASCGEYSVILCHVFSKCTPLEMGPRCVYNESINGTVHVATCTYVQSYMLCRCCVCVYVCVYVCVCMQVLCSRMVKVHLHNVYWYTCIKVCEPSIKVYSV